MVAVNRAGPELGKRSSDQAERNLCTLNELLRDDKIHWTTIIKKEKDLRILRNVFKRKIRKKVTYRHMTTFLISSEHLPNVSDTVVVEETDKLSKSLMSSRHTFDLRRLKSGKKIDKLEDCFMEEHDIRKTINRIFTIFDLKTHIGPTNCGNIREWVVKTLVKSDLQKLPEFVYKEVPIARSFRAKKVMQSVDPHSKRTIQTQIINNLRAGLCWWTIISLKQILIPVRVEIGFQNCWRYGYLKMIKREMEEFKERYKVKKLCDEQSIKTASRSRTNILKFLIVNNKFRPIVRGVTENIHDSIKQKMNWKKVNSLLSWCLESSGVTRQTIKQSCQVISNFLTKNSKSENLFVYTADITKCFAHIGHQLLLEIIQKLLMKERVVWITCAMGKNEKGFTQFFYCSADSKEQLSERVKKKMASKHVTNYTEQFTDKYSTNWLISVLESLLSSFYYKRSSTYFQINNGVPQGHPMSSILALMYLADFEKKYWRKEKKDPKITYCRYEDDYIFLTTQKEIFNQMINPLLTGENTHKLRANLDKSKASEDRGVLEWCGVQMDLKERKFSRRRLCKDGVRRKYFIKL